ncbi:hypothetical protein [Actinomycetospora termitidis]|uniref:Uncharacterized protein n=1 Tax=Actinomycetospora termitidis TaxID=3053470 RepID=A0ABT7MH01_9PSEU|nr:hypothetical protein [Actinomycetospora sp. Odt1-22]MDL5159449.1 hypothetical protein [Actinomycetospora sp. Odt1-22]
MWRKFGRRSAKVGKFGWKHRKRVFGLVAAFAFVYVAVYFAYVGTVSLVQVLVLVTALVGAGLAKHHENMAFRRHMADHQPQPSWRERREWARGHGHRAPHRTPEPAPGTIYVRSHRRDGDGVEAYTRAAPGRGEEAS